MTQIRLYIDEDSNKRSLVDALRRVDVDVITVVEAGRVGLADDAQLSWASGQMRCLYSANIADFCRIHSDWMEQNKRHAGLILVQQKRYSIGDIQQGMLNLMVEQTTESMQNQLIFLRRYF